MAAQRVSWGWAAVPLVALGLGLFFLPSVSPQSRGLAFLGAVLLLASELVIIGFLVNGRPAGAFIDNRNMLSLSKLQAGVWTVIVLSAFATAAAFNASVPHPPFNTVSALEIVIPGELLLAMGISATSLVATPALLSLKAAEDPVDTAEQDAANRVGRTVTANGKLLIKMTPKDASWADLVTGEELGNAGTPDLGKIQQALISLVLTGTYAGYVYQYFAVAPPAITTLPMLDKTFVWLLGLSHASYLAYKAVPHTKSAS